MQTKSYHAPAWLALSDNPFAPPVYTWRPRSWMHRPPRVPARAAGARWMLPSGRVMWPVINDRDARWGVLCQSSGPPVAAPLAACACVALYGVQDRVRVDAEPPPGPRRWLHRVAACPFYGSCRVSSGAIAVIDPLLRERRQCGCNWQPQRRNAVARCILSAAPSPAVPSARPCPPMQSRASTPALRAARRAAARSVASAPAG